MKQDQPQQIVETTLDVPQSHVFDALRSIGYSIPREAKLANIHETDAGKTLRIEWSKYETPQLVVLAKDK